MFKSSTSNHSAKKNGNMIPSASKQASYLGVLITDIAAQVLIYAIYCLKAYCAKKQSENVKLRRERYAGISGEENNGSLNEILSAGADSTEPVPFTNGATVNVYDYGADNGSVG